MNPRRQKRLRWDYEWLLKLRDRPLEELLDLMLKAGLIRYWKADRDYRGKATPDDKGPRRELRIHTNSGRHFCLRATGGQFFQRQDPPPHAKGFGCLDLARVLLDRPPFVVIVPVVAALYRETEMHYEDGSRKPAWTLQKIEDELMRPLAPLAPDPDEEEEDPSVH